MKIAIVSDTHKQWAPLFCDLRKREFDVLIHLGDGLEDARSKFTSLSDGIPLLTKFSFRGKLYISN